MKIKIVTTPPGEAPKKVRDAWVGLTLPLAVNGKKTGMVLAYSLEAYLTLL